MWTCNEAKRRCWGCISGDANATWAGMHYAVLHRYRKSWRPWSLGAISTRMLREKRSEAERKDKERKGKEKKRGVNRSL